MISINTLLKLAMIEAQKSEHTHRLGAVLFSKNKILNLDHNYALRSAKHLHPRHQRWPGSIHAEVACILSARCNLKNSIMFLVRINRNDELMLAKPCAHCMTYLEHVGVKKVIYSITNGFEEITL